MPWKAGDGWNQVNREMNAMIREHARPGFFAWHDPAVRVEQDLLIAPSALEDRPVFIELARLNRKILLVDIEE